MRRITIFSGPWMWRRMWRPWNGRWPPGCGDQRFRPSLAGSLWTANAPLQGAECKDSREVAYAITRLAQEPAWPRKRPAPPSCWNSHAPIGARAHWGIENRPHLVRDVSFAEDAWRVRSGAAPQTLAAFRNTVLTLMRRRSGQITEEIEHFQENGQQALNLVRFGRIE